MISQQTTLIPLAGAGSRFIHAGYTEPKPLIMVDGLPMVIQAVKQLPLSQRYIFLCRSEHLNNYLLRQTLEQYYPGCIVQEVAYLTKGQASTCLLAEANIIPDQPLFIGACDNGLTYDKMRYQALVTDPTVDGLVFTFRNNVTVERNPKAYGWVKVLSDDRVEYVSVKVPISDDPVHDHAVVGAFWFRCGQMFIDAAKAMIQKNTRINNEFYVDECINNAVAAGLCIKVFEIDKYICWGTPNDLAVYNYWKTYFTQHHPIV